jgi:hypothetical protein
MLRGWIEIQLTNGQRFKYVRDRVVIAGDSVANSLYYQYGDSTGDTILYQTGAGKLYGDFITIKADYLGAAAYDLLLFPESTGDTETIKRQNFDMPETIPYQLGGDSTIKAYRYTTVSIESVVSINLVETFAPPAENVYIP